MRVFRVSNEAGCLSEMGLIILHKLFDEKELVSKKVQTMTGISLRRFVKIPIESVVRTKKGFKTVGIRDVWADWVTGSLYELSGECVSSPNLRIIETKKKPYCSIKDMMDKFKFGHGADYEYGSN
jgi:hypothetical protein